jgi:hypothetical protein
MVAVGTLDRRDMVPVDRFVIDVPQMEQHPQHLGDPAKFAIELSPGTARIHADVTLESDRLKGLITVHQADLHLEPTLGPNYTKFISPENLATAVKGVDHLQADVALSGSLKAPKYQIQSNLGPQLAAGFNQAMRQELQRQEQRLVSKANGEVEQQLAKLQSELLAKHGRILEQLQIGDEQLEQLKRQLLSQV